MQVLQVGAQNQNATGRPATAEPSNSPPPTRGAVKRSASGTAVSTEVGVVAAVPRSESFAAVNETNRTFSANHVYLDDNLLNTASDV